MGRWLAIVPMLGCGFQAHAPADAGGSRDAVDGATIDAEPDAMHDAMHDATVTTTPIRFVQGAIGAVSSGSATTVAADFAAAPMSGSLVVAVVSWSDSSAPSVMVADSNGTAFAWTGAFDTSGGLSQEIHYAPNVTASGVTFTATFGASVSKPKLRIYEYSGIAPTAPVDTSANASGASATSDSGAATTTHAHDLIFGADVVTVDTTGPGAMFTSRGIDHGDLVEDREVTTIGSYDATAPLDNVGSWVMQMIAFEGAN